MEISKLVETIENKRGAEVRMHPYGFLQLSLSEGAWRDFGYRLHIWSDELPPMKRPEFQVHDHIYQVKSRVLIGELKDMQYTVTEDPAGVYVLFEAADGKLFNTGKKVLCEERKILCISAGAEYSVAKGDFHSSLSMAPMTVTLFQKIDANLSLSPQVIGPGWYEKTEVLPDDRTFDQKFAWEVLERVLGKIRKKAS